MRSLSKASSSVRGLRIVEERRASGAIPLYVHPEWTERFPWLIQGTTARGPGEAFDLRLFGVQPVGTVLGRWRELRNAVGFSRAVHAHQVHGARVIVHGEGPTGLSVLDDSDGHATRTPDVLLTVSVADCIPIFLVDPDGRAVALLHGGWRGVAEGIVEAGVEALCGLTNVRPESLYVHFGPAICGSCYEVGPEVYEALGLDRPPTNRSIDLRAVAAARAVEMGVSPERITLSAHCTRCDGSPFFSHRRGCQERQVGILGIRPQPTESGS